MRDKKAQPPGDAQEDIQEDAQADAQPDAAPVAPADAQPDAPQAAAPQPLSARRAQYLIARSPGPLPQGVDPADVGAIAQLIQSGRDQSIDFVRVVEAPKNLALLAADPNVQHPIVVARMTEDTAVNLQQQNPALLVERDRVVSLPANPASPGPARDPGVIAPLTVGFEVALLVAGPNNTPVPGADIFVYGSTGVAKGQTDQNGQAVLALLGETPDSIGGLYIKPKADFWSLYVERPQLTPAPQVTLAALRPLDEMPQLRGFPGQQIFGWGQKAMKLDQLLAANPSFRGRNAKVAVVDSGAAMTHPDLQPRVKAGFDIIGPPPSDQTWNNDLISHGSHCAGVIGGADNGQGVVGFAPEADLYVYRIFPGGRFSDVIDALSRCIDERVDVVNLSLGTADRSELLEQKILQAKQQGVACIVAAGNSAGPVQFPANSSNVLAVAAIGKLGEFPDDSYHATQINVPAGGPAPNDGYFSAKFTCFGAEIDVCGPGVAIVSSVPQANFAAWDGTSMAAPHITGLAALILAHHPDFQARGKFQARDAARVDRLFEILKQSCQSLSIGDRNRTGAGMPDATRAFQLSAVQPTPTPATPTTQPVSAPSAVPDSIEDIFRYYGIGAGSSATPQAAGAFAPQSANGGSLAPQSADGGATAPATPSAAADPVRQALAAAGLLTEDVSTQATSDPAAPVDAARQALIDAGILPSAGGSVDPQSAGHIASRPPAPQPSAAVVQRLREELKRMEDILRSTGVS